jgi:two-component system, cell cycle sensor histidine kinase and response regulator CckA
MKRTILLVDDDVDLLQAVSELLRSSGYVVCEHSDSVEALEYFCENQDLMCIVTDIDMPVMDGISLVAEIQAIRPDAEALLMTGNFEHSERECSHRLLRKPFTCLELMTALERCAPNELRHGCSREKSQTRRQGLFSPNVDDVR